MKQDFASRQSGENMSDSLPALEAENLSVVLGGVKVLDVPSLKVMPNEVLVVIGPNGSGKTTLLLTLAGLLKPASGTILYHGLPSANKEDTLKLHRRIAVAFQDPLLLSSTVLDNVTLGLRLRSVAKEEIQPRAIKWLERFGVATLAGRNAKTLSGGEAKRTSLARAFALQPDILFLDEAFNGLDSHSRESIIEDFQDVLRETKVTTIMITHDSSEAQALADRIIVLMGGQIRQIGKCGEVFSNPADLEVAEFVEVTNIIQGVVAASRDGISVVAINHHLIETVSNYHPVQQVSILIRPEEITLAATKPSNSARNSFEGTITRLISTGALTRVEIDCGFPLVALVTKRSAEDMNLDKGKHIYASFKATGVHVIKR